MKSTLNSTTLRWLTNAKAEQCDISGKVLGPSSVALPVYDDMNGNAWVRLVPVMPSNTDPASVSMKEAYLALKPVFVDGDGTMRGWYVPAPDFSKEPVAA